MLKKEKIYFEKVAPLLSEIYKICEENEIQMVSSFYLGETEEGDMVCNTYLDSNENSESIIDAIKVLQYDHVAIPEEILEIVDMIMRTR